MGISHLRTENHTVRKKSVKGGKPAEAQEQKRLREQVHKRGKGHKRAEAHGRRACRRETTSKKGSTHERGSERACVQGRREACMTMRGNMLQHIHKKRKASARKW